MKRKQHGIAMAAVAFGIFAQGVLKAEDKTSGTLNFDLNSHFISYGADVWKDGQSLDSPTFNPSLELALKLPCDLTATLGTWMDVNNHTTSNLGGDIQEIDLWAGLSYTYDKFTFSGTYQAWNYASATEEVVDFKIAYDTFLSPSLTIHNRIEEGGSGGNNGTILVFGVSKGFEAGPVSISVPLGLAYFLEDDFHGSSIDSGIGYGTIGLNATLPLAAISEDYGKWNLHGGLTYYITSGDVVGNPDDQFVTANLGVGVAF